jgi:hypothetical protein
MLYYLMKHCQICLPFLLFNHLKESIRKTRTTALEKKKIPTYIPFGRLLSDIFVESELVKILEEDAKMTEDLTLGYGEALNAKNLRNMGILEKVKVPPAEVSVEEVFQARNPHVEGFPLWIMADAPKAVAHYLQMMTEEADMEIDSKDLVQMLPDAPIFEDPVSGKKHARFEHSDSDQNTQKKAKTEDKKVDSHLAQHREPIKVTR